MPRHGPDAAGAGEREGRVRQSARQVRRRGHGRARVHPVAEHVLPLQVEWSMATVGGTVPRQRGEHGKIKKQSMAQNGGLWYHTGVTSKSETGKGLIHADDLPIR